MKAKAARNLLLILLGFLGLGAIGGGGVFIISPNGKLIGMPLSVLGNTPFVSFSYTRDHIIFRLRTFTLLIGSCIDKEAQIHFC